MAFSLDDYVDVGERIQMFYEEHPEGSLTTESVYTMEIAGQQFVVCHTKAWRSPEDPFPGDGVAWEIVPGKTPYTKDSEVMNAQTASWGRAIVACGILTSKAKIASKQEVKARQGDGHTNGSEAARGAQNGSQARPRLVDHLRGAIRSYDSKELADQAEWDSLIASATDNQSKKTLVDGLEAKLEELGGNPSAVVEAWQRACEKFDREHA